MYASVPNRLKPLTQVHRPNCLNLANHPTPPRNRFRDTEARYSGMWWLIVRVDAIRPEGRGFESRSSRHVGTLGKSLTRSCLWRFGVRLRHSIRAVSGALLSSSGLEEAL